MKLRSTRRTAWIAALALVAAAGSVNASKFDSDVTVVNQSLWNIDQMYISSTEEGEWGPDQLGADIVGTGDQFTITGIPCDDYDVRLIDEDGDECVIGGVTLCADNDAWVISDEDLLTCQALTE